ncbi:MAG: SDR family NAD(P)-dependent oxidoreductase [Ignavibacteriaceae bacterium]|nr:SDR family NAD(P)-dependent oxidoreductase [Ignavibacteriaceae bacterium]
MNFENKQILITGASTGIGRELAIMLANFNCTIYLTARRYELLEELKESLSNAQAKIEIYKNDASDKAEVDELCNKLITTGLDIAILNAAVSLDFDHRNYEIKKVQETFDVNFFGVVNFINALLPYFRERSAGVFVPVSSLAGERGYALNPHYCASKAALTTYCEGLKPHLAKNNIKLLVVKPGYVKTPMTAKNKHSMPLMISAQKAAKIILRGIDRNTPVIQFPFLTAISTYIVKFLPRFIFDIINRNLVKDK